MRLQQTLRTVPYLHNVEFYDALKRMLTKTTCQPSCGNARICETLYDYRHHSKPKSPICCCRAERNELCFVHADNRADYEYKLLDPSTNIPI
jgi:hypothetical protein